MWCLLNINYSSYSKICFFDLLTHHLLKADIMILTFQADFNDFISILVYLQNI